MRNILNFNCWWTNKSLVPKNEACTDGVWWIIKQGVQQCSPRKENALATTVVRFIQVGVSCATPRLLCFSIPWTHTSLLSDCGATTYLHAALHCPGAQTPAVTDHHTCRFGVYTPCANGPWHNSGSSTGCSSEKHLFRLFD